MTYFNRRAFLGLSAGALSVVTARGSLAQLACTSGLPGFLPTMLTVDCASRRNFQLFRKNSTYIGLTGVVSMSFVRTPSATFQAGNLFLFPWLKPKGVSLNKTWASYCPISASGVKSVQPITAALPADGYFCESILGAPAGMFIGFGVDVPYSKVESRFDWFTNVDKLPDGQGVGIDWTSSNLNQPWFAGAQTIPNTDACNGNGWRKLVVEGLKQASTSVC